MLASSLVWQQEQVLWTSGEARTHFKPGLLWPVKAVRCQNLQLPQESRGCSAQFAFSWPQVGMASVLVRTGHHVLGSLCHWA